MSTRNLLVTVLLLSCSQFVMAQKDEGDDTGAMLRAIGWIAKDPAIRAELDISESQAADLERAAKEVRSHYERMWRERGDELREIGRLKEEGRMDEVKLRWEAIQADMRESAQEQYEVIDQTLLPHQVSRMRQITLQQRLKRENPYRDELGAPLALADRLGLSEEQKAKLKEAIEKARKEFYAEVRDLKKKATDDIMSALPEDKQKQLKELMGDTYDPNRAREELRGQWQSFSRSRANANKKEREEKNRP